ncbi:MAG TPA: ORF6N domain-containing protein [Crocinitomicaceae bacterium]|nr:ORF6N domain-containing protein [Crocinitomicaceae bacterium]
MELQTIQQRIYEIRGMKVMLDFDLAELYETETKRLKEAVRRNISRFPPDFMFELTNEEHLFLRSQIATLEKDKRGKHSNYLLKKDTQNKQQQSRKKIGFSQKE